MWFCAPGNSSFYPYALYICFADRGGGNEYSKGQTAHLAREIFPAKLTLRIWTEICEYTLLYNIYRWELKFLPEMDIHALDQQMEVYGCLWESGEMTPTPHINTAAYHGDTLDVEASSWTQWASEKPTWLWYLRCILSLSIAWKWRNYASCQRQPEFLLTGNAAAVGSIFSPLRCIVVLIFSSLGWCCCENLIEQPSHSLETYGTSPPLGPRPSIRHIVLSHVRRCFRRL